MTLRLRGSTSGYAEINAPAVAGDNSLTLPTTTGTVRVAGGVGVVDGDYTVSTGATISGSINVITASTNGSERLRITSDGNVNIGGNYGETSHPLNISDSTKPSLCLHTGTTQRADFSATTGITSIRSFSNSPFTINIGGSGENEAFRISGTGDIGINKSSIVAFGSAIPTIEIKGRAESGAQVGRSGAICFESGSGTNGYATLWGNEGGIEYYSSSTDRDSVTYGCKFTSSGNLAFASGKGVDFSANSDTGRTVISNVLDDYEEGTWTPVIKSGNNTISYTGGTQYFTYIKIGNKVTLSFNLSAATTSGTIGGAFTMEGIPFLGAANSRNIGSLCNFYGSGLRATNWPSFIHIDATSNFDIYYKTASNSNYDRDTVAEVGTNTYMMWTATYFVD